MKLRTLKQLLNACPNDEVDIEVNVKTEENNAVCIDSADFEYLDYGTDKDGNVVSLVFTVKI